MRLQSTWLLALGAATILAGCASMHAPRGVKTQAQRNNPDQIAAHYNRTQQLYGSDNQFHVAVLKPNFFKLEFPGYLVGIEKANYVRVGEPIYGNCKGKSNYCLDTETPYYRDKTEVREALERRIEGGTLAKLFRYAETQIVTHIVRYENSAANPSDWRGCLIYNTYGSPKVDGCPPGGVLPVDKPVNGEARNDYTVGWDAITALRQDINRVYFSGVDRTGGRRPAPTHLFLFSTGWNTAQWESMANYTDLYRNLVTAAAKDGADFRPLFIGLSWPSLWPNQLGDIGGDLVNKKNDADEIGIIWANLLIQKVLLPLKIEHGTPVVLVGHSFGARIVSRAAFSAPLLGSRNDEVDLLIGLQGAFTANRFANGVGASDAPYRDFHSRFVTNSVFTTSDNDQAVGKIIKYLRVQYIGAGKFYRNSQKRRYRGIFSQLALNSSGNFSGPEAEWKRILCARDKVKLVDANNVVRLNVPGTGGKAHSDIYTPQIGRFVWNLVKMIPECNRRRSGR